VSAGAAGDIDPVARFTEAAERFCAWAESPPTKSRREAHDACALMLELLRASVDLTPTQQFDPEPVPVEEAEWRRVLSRFDSTSWPRLYAEVEPTAPEQGVQVYDLHEDLADVWRDVRECLDLILLGHAPAGISHWHLRFELTLDVTIARILHVLLPERRSGR
jgi:hypothetical protein